MAIIASSLIFKEYPPHDMPCYYGIQAKTTLPSWSLQSSIVVNQYIKSLPLAGYEQDGMTEDTKGTLTYDQKIGV